MVAELIPHPYLSDYALITTQTSNKGDYYMSVRGLNSTPR